MVGNDIVDLSYFDAPSFQHVGYLERVCTAEEVRLLRRCSDTCKYLAVLWTAKEAAYKLVSRNSTVGHFVPRQFVSHSLNPSLFPEGEIVISIAGLEVKVRAKLTERWVHSVATSPEVQAVRWAVREIRKDFPADMRVEAESQAARSLANDLLLEYAPPGVTLQFSGRVPRVESAAKPIRGMDISLSHHGTFAAAAIAWGPDHTFRAQKEICGLLKDSPLEATCCTSTA